MDPSGSGHVKGALLTFLPDCVEDAFCRVSDMEPGEQYRWHEVLVDAVHTNMLVGRSPTRGSVPCEDGEWDGWRDPLFTVAHAVVASAHWVRRRRTSAGSYRYPIKMAFF